jgi:hypothetical protein
MTTTTDTHNLLNLAAHLYAVSDGRKIQTIKALREAHQAFTGARMTLMAAKNLVDAACDLYALTPEHPQPYPSPLAAHLQALRQLLDLGITVPTMRAVVRDRLDTVGMRASDEEILMIIRIASVLNDPEMPTSRLR